jgi:uncharacterized protein (TIGR03083 family)
MSDEIWAHIDRQRADLADYLEALTPEQWATSSLCEGWTVRDVAVHLTQSAAPWSRMAFEAVRSGFRFNAMMARAAREDASTSDEIVQTLRGMVGGRRHPPGTAPADPLMDTLVHGQDIAIPLGLSRTVPIAPAVIAAERLWAMGFPLHAKKRFPGVQLIADDADFRVGAGAPVTGRMSDILLALAGRQAGLAALSGPVPAVAYRAASGEE